MFRRIFWCLVAFGLPALALTAVSAPPPNLNRALDAQRELVARSPDDARALNDLGNLLMLAGDLEAAETAYRRALDIEPGKASARYNLALLLQQRNRRKEAFRQLRLLVTEHPDYAWGWYQIGSLYDLAGQKNKAVESYATAFRLDPQLAFSEVNPHVIDNRYFTQALIRANRGSSAGNLAPKAYDEPARITGILVPPLALDGEEAPMDDVAESEAEPAAEDAMEPDETVARSGRVLSEGDLDAEGSVNQVQGGGARGGSRYTRPGTVRRPTATRSNRPRFQSPQRGTAPNAGGRNSGVQVRGSIGLPNAGNQPTDPEDGVGTPDTDSSGRPLTSPRGRVRYRPGTSSTGSSGTELVPR